MQANLSHVSTFELIFRVSKRILFKKCEKLCSDAIKASYILCLIRTVAYTGGWRISSEIN